MSVIVSAMDLVLDRVRSKQGLDSGAPLCSVKQSERAATYTAYAVFALCAIVVLMQFTDHDFSLVLTASSGVQCLGLYCLSVKVRSQRTVDGLSLKTLEMYALVFTFRLSSTMVKNGYLPVDRSGDWVYQATDVASLLLVFQCMFMIHKRYSLTYQAELDSMPIWKIVPAFMLLGCCCHGELNHSAFFDKTWTIGMWMDTIAMLPQLWMLVAKGGEVEALTSNFVALVFASRMLAFWFWFTGMPELAPKDGSFNLVGSLIVGAHSIQLLLSADFMYHYFVHATETQCGSVCGVDKGMGLPKVLEV